MEEEAKKACAEIWQKYKPLVWNYVNKRMPDRTDRIDDVVANVATAFVELYNSGSTVEYPTTWFLLTAKNFVNREFDDIRRTNNLNEKLDNKIAAKVNYSVTMEDRIISEDMLLEIKDGILGRLKPKELQLYKYVYVQELSYKEIAEITGSSTVAVKQSVFRLNSKLREYTNEAINKNF